MYSIDKFIQTLREGVLMNQYILNSSREVTSESTDESIIIPADEALTETELDGIFSSWVYLSEDSEPTLMVRNFIEITECQL